MSDRLVFGGVCLLFAGITLFVAGCGGGSGVSTGQLQVTLTDATGTYDKVVLSVQAIRVVPVGQGGQNTGTGLPLIVQYPTPQVLDVLTLAFSQQVMGSAAVPAGEYEQVRLVLAPNPTTGDPVNYVTLPGDPNTKLALDTPSGQQSGLKVLGRFEVKPGVLNAIALDFDPARAIVEAGASNKRLLKPTGIRVVQMSSVLPTYGSISGTVLPDTTWSDAVVSVIPQGQAIPIAMGSVDPTDGHFVAFVPAGTYYLKITAPGFQTYDTSQLPTPVFYTVTLQQDMPAGDLTLSP